MNARAGEHRITAHSFTQPDDIRMTHADLVLRVDFETQRLHGTATLDIDNKSGARTLYLDTWRLKILKVTLDPQTHNEPATFLVGDEVETIGSPLAITVKPATRQVRIDYETTDGARALQWVTPQQTRDKNQPFLYTQSQSINARSWVPCQDVPSVRFSYRAEVQVPAGLMAIMSARNGFEKSADGAYVFDMPQPIPAYLLALAVGDFAFQRISERCGVFAEPSLLQQTAWEFADVERMMQVAEALYGPYRWERFDGIVLPPSFPYGGMENPRVTGSPEHGAGQQQHARHQAEMVEQQLAVVLPVAAPTARAGLVQAPPGSQDVQLTHVTLATGKRAGLAPRRRGRAWADRWPSVRRERGQLPPAAAGR
jgi:aminopeptidase N